MRALAKAVSHSESLGKQRPRRQTNSPELAIKTREGWRWLKCSQSSLFEMFETWVCLCFVMNQNKPLWVKCTAPHMLQPVWFCAAPWIAGWWRVLASSQAQRPSNALKPPGGIVECQKFRLKKWILKDFYDLALPRCKTTRRPEISLSGTCHCVFFGATAQNVAYFLQSFHEKHGGKNTDIQRSWQDHAAWTKWRNAEFAIQCLNIF